MNDLFRTIIRKSSAFDFKKGQVLIQHSTNKQAVIIQANDSEPTVWILTLKPLSKYKLIRWLQKQYYKITISRKDNKNPTKQNKQISK